MTRHTTERLGIRVTPHDARDAAATTWAIAAPHQIEIARARLTHADLQTTTKYYNRAKGIEASRTQNELIARLRRKADTGGRWQVKHRCSNLRVFGGQKHLSIEGDSARSQGDVDVPVQAAKKAIQVGIVRDTSHKCLVAGSPSPECRDEQGCHRCAHRPADSSA